MKPTKRPKTKPKIKASRPKGRGKRALTNPSKGKVGIFWVFRKQLLAATFALADGQAYGDAINGLTDHVKYWPRLQQQHPVLRWLEYQDVPRGRVLFMKPAGEYHVYMDKTLHRPQIQRALLKEFDLPSRSTQFLADAHYTTDPGELELLFT